MKKIQKTTQFSAQKKMCSLVYHTTTILRYSYSCCYYYRQTSATLPLLVPCNKAILFCSIRETINKKHCKNIIMDATLSRMCVCVRHSREETSGLETFLLELRHDEVAVKYETVSPLIVTERISTAPFWWKSGKADKKPHTHTRTQDSRGYGKASDPGT